MNLCVPRPSCSERFVALLVTLAASLFGCAASRTQLTYPLGTVAHEAELMNVDSSAEGSVIVSRDGDGVIKAWNGTNCALLSTTKGSRHASPFAIAADGSLVAWFDGDLRVSAPASLAAAKAIPTTFGGKLWFSADTKTLRFVGSGGIGSVNLAASSVNERAVPAQVLEDPKELFHGAFRTPDERYLVLFGRMGRVTILALPGFEFVSALRLPGPDREVSVALAERSPGRFFMAVGHTNAEISLLTIPEGRRVAILSTRGRREREKDIVAIHIAAEEDRIVELDDAGTLSVWSLSERDLLYVWEPSAALLYRRPLLIDGSTILSVTEENEIRFSSLPSGAPAFDLEVKNVRKIQFLSKLLGGYVAAAEREIFVFDATGALRCSCQDGFLQ